MNRWHIRQERRHDFPTVVIENDALTVECIPTLGGKITRLVDRAHQRDVLLPSQLEGIPYRRASYGQPFESFDVSGFDECFPTIAATRLSGQGRGEIDFPDHGELWSAPWSWRETDEGISLAVEGVRWNYLFEKRLAVKDNRLVASYSLTNRERFPFRFLWSAHPLLQVRPGARILLPENVDHVLVNWSSDDHAGRLGDVRRWPCLISQEDYSVVPPATTNRAVKCFSERLTQGFAAVYHPADECSVLFSFDPREIPFLGIWLCYGGWPTGARQKHFTVALEPCNGRPDSLQQAVDRNECGHARPQEEVRWSMEISLTHGLPVMPSIGSQVVSARSEQR